MEAAKGSIQYDSNGIQECQDSGKLTSSCKKYIGVKKCESGRFTAMITDPITKKRRGLGTYDTAEQAAAAYDFAAEMMRGTKARTNSITFNPFKLTQSAAPTLRGSAAFSQPFSSKLSNRSSSLLNKPFNPPFVSKPSNPDNPFSRSVFNQSSQKQDNQVFHLESSSTMASSPLHKFRSKNQDICASGRSMSTNDITLPCSVSYTLSIQVPSSPMASTLNKNTSTVPETIFTTQSLPNPVFPSSHRFPTHLDQLSSTFQSQQCSALIPRTSMHSTPTAVPETISTTKSFPSPVFSSIHRFIPHVEELVSTPQSQQCITTTTTTTIPCTSFHSTSGLFNLDLQKGLYENQNNQQCIKQYDMEVLSSTASAVPETIDTTQFLPSIMFPSHHSFLPHEEELFSVLQSELCSKSTDCITTQSITGLSNLNVHMQKGLPKNKNEQQGTKQGDLEKELQDETESSSKESLGFEEWFNELKLPDADFLLENIPLTSLPSLDNIWD